jgi:SAM-dependent methyltransferase
MNKNVLRIKKAVHSFLREMRSDPYKLHYMGDAHYCPICKTGVNQFNTIEYKLIEMADKYQMVYPMFSFETMNMFGYSCPRCYANDRDRLYALYIEKKFANVPEGTKYNLLDIAPSLLSGYLRKLPYLNYRSADLYNPADDKVDITDMNIYEDGRFDVFVCSHVLEHIKDDIKAMKELHRVLKPGGWGIAMVPITNAIEETYENDSITTDADRWKYFGQDDHVRMYSKKGFVGNLEKAGFKVDQLGIDYFGSNVFERHGIHPRSILYIVSKI